MSRSCLPVVIEHRLADVVERDAMSCRQRLDRGDAGDDVVVDVDAGGDGVEDAQRAVVERRVAPRQEGADTAGFQFGFDGVGPQRPPARRASRRPPAGRPGCRGGPGALRVGQFDEPVARLADESLADLTSQRHQVALRLGTLVHREEHLRVVERRDRLCRHIVRIARADTDHVDPPLHGASMRQ